MKKFLTLLTALFIFLCSFRQTLAINDPLSVTNNKFGIHILDENDLIDASKLVNTSGGDWGYVTVVITEGERNHDRWQKAFDNMRRLHLIPIIRLATKAEGDTWAVPKEEEINNWIAFLGSLNWVIENRYVIIGNEPNHAKEWGGSVDPAGYATYLKTFSQRLKGASDDFYVLPAGLDASAPNSKVTMDETKFIAEMLKKEPDIFNHIDGWVSHSYANPDFSGASSARGKGTVSTFDWELNHLKSLGVAKELPVFITEAGWSNTDLNEGEIGERFEDSFKNVWASEKVAAVTPFILNYPSPPFDNFSWKRSDGTFYSFYDRVSALTKIKGEPIQVVKGKIFGVFVNPFVLAGSSFKGVVLAQNMGQSIWTSLDIVVADQDKNVTITTQEFGEVEPQKLHLIYVDSMPISEAGIYKSNIVLRYKERDVSESYPIEIVVVKPAEVKNVPFFAKLLGLLKNLF